MTVTCWCLHCDQRLPAVQMSCHLWQAHNVAHHPRWLGMVRGGCSGWPPPQPSQALRAAYQQACDGRLTQAPLWAAEEAE